MSDDSSRLRLRGARVGDAAYIWRLVGASGALDLNSSYAYLLMCDRFADTCVVATAPDSDDEIAGFVIGFLPPRQPDTVFVWQIGVSSAARGRGVGSSLLDELVAMPACAGVRFLESTITADNEASQRLFRSFAGRRGADVAVSDAYTTSMFPDNKATEQLYRIGPFEPRSAQ